jgi:hypothetical protein
MIPEFTILPTIFNGISYGMRLALQQVDHRNPGHANDPEAIMQALWFRFIIAMLNGIIAVGIYSPVAVIVTFTLIIIIDTLAYPVVSHFALTRAGLEARFPQFITAYTWLGNFRILLVVTIFFVSHAVNAPRLQLAVVPIGFWMIWASWSVATHSIGRGGWVGAGMVGLTVVLKLVLTLVTVSVFNPEFFDFLSVFR